MRDGAAMLRPASTRQRALRQEPAGVYIARVLGPTSSLDALRARLASLPQLSPDLPPVRGELKRTPDDFVVEELPAYLPSGSGEHLYLWVEKRGLNTQEAVARLAHVLGARAEAAGYAGLKDRRAVTRQWLSFHHAGTPRVSELASEGLAVLAVSRHTNKLRTGHLHGNRFTVRLAAVPPEDDRHAEAVLARLSELGVPNYYGAQRFGLDGKNLEAAFAWVLQGGRAPRTPFLRKLYVSVLQSALFNAWLAERIERGAYLCAERGDILRKEDSGGLFTCEDPELDSARVRRWEISATGPMFGARMRAPEADALAHEAALLHGHGITFDHLVRVQKYGEGTRRPLRARLSASEVRREAGDLVLSFTLPKGSYATVALAELTKQRALTLGEDG